MEKKPMQPIDVRPTQAPAPAPAPAAKPETSLRGDPLPAGIGHNAPTDQAIIDEVTARLDFEYQDLEAATADTLRQAKGLPPTVDSDATSGATADIVKSLRDLSRRAEAARVAEKAPYLRAGQAVDSHFKAVGARLDKAVSVLVRRINEFNTRKAEQARREREEAARKAEEERRAAREAAAKAEREEIERQRAAEAAAKRARESQREDFQQDAETAARDYRASNVVADAAFDEAEAADRRAEAAAEAAGAKTADLVRSRSERGALITSRTVRKIVIDDYDAIPLDVLRPYLNRKEIERAVKAYDKVTGAADDMPGVRAWNEDAAVIR